MGVLNNDDNNNIKLVIINFNNHNYYNISIKDKNNNIMTDP